MTQITKIFASSKMCLVPRKQQVPRNTLGVGRSHFTGTGDRNQCGFTPPHISGNVVSRNGAKGIAVLPVSKKDPWFWTMGEVVIDWVDIPIGTPLFVSGTGKTVCTAVRYRICLFDAYGREPSHRKTHTQPTVNSDDDRTKDSQDTLPAMPSAEDLMSEVCSTSDSDSRDMDDPRGTGLNCRHRRLL